MTYQWTQGARIRLDPQMVGERFEAIGAEGPLTPESVLDDARSPLSPLHAVFEWDDTVAAEGYRRQQAGLLLRAIVIRVERTGRAEPFVVRAFVPADAQPGGGRSYAQIGRVMSDADLRRQYLAEGLRRLEVVKRAYEEAEEFASIYGAIEETRVKLNV